MYILSEKEFEDILVLHPELIEEGLTLIDRQAKLESRRTDLTFRDGNDSLLLIELKRDIINEESLKQIEDYIKRLKRSFDNPFRAMLVGQFVPTDIRNACELRSIEWKEIQTEYIFSYLQKADPALYDSFFIKDKLHSKAKEVNKLSFQDYLKKTSPFGVPYTTYQHFLPQDASPELSKNSLLNQEVADEFINRLMKMPFDRKIFNEKVRIFREYKEIPKKEFLTKDGAWQGYNIGYKLVSDDYPGGLACKIYLGSIGYRGNKPIFADNLSRFIVVSVGKQPNSGSSQYGFHKYLRAEARALMPHYELKFNAVSLSKTIWPNIYNTLHSHNYFVSSPEGKKENKKLIYFGDVQLGNPDCEQQLSNLLEGLFAVSVVKEHFKKKGPSFPGLFS